MEFMEIPRFCALCLAIAAVLVLHTQSSKVSSSIVKSLEPNEELKQVKTLKSDYGDVYDCVELYKQSAFDHPLLKHHKIQMRPTISLKNKKWEKNSPKSSSTFGLKQTCPSGTVPIRRVTQDEKLQAEATFLQQFQPSNSSSPRTNSLPLLFAGMSSTLSDEYSVFAAGGYVSVHNPTVVENGQSSYSTISLERGTSEIFSTIRVGWMVNPGLYNGDNQTRLYAVWSQWDGEVVHGCFNNYCPGFVQVNPNIPVDMVLPNAPDQFIFQALQWENTTGNWWYFYGENKDVIGYWPSDLFKELKFGAKIVRWGGLVSTDSQNVPDMGSGLIGPIGSCHFRKVTCLFNNGTIPVNEDLPMKPMETKCYKVGGASVSPDPDWGFNFWFGGKGGDINQCN